jgi:hypothetical protein
MATRLHRHIIRAMLVLIPPEVRQLAFLAAPVHTLDRRHQHVRAVLPEHIQAQQPLHASIVVPERGPLLDQQLAALVEQERTRLPMLQGAAHAVLVNILVRVLRLVTLAAPGLGLGLARRDVLAAMQVRGPQLLRPVLLRLVLNVPVAIGQEQGQHLAAAVQLEHGRLFLARFPLIRVVSVA